MLNADKNGEEKTTFIFNEDIMINFNYELPEGNYVFRLQIEPDLEITKQRYFKKRKS